MNKFKLIYADPPWSYGNKATRAHAEMHYPTMKTAELIAMRVDKIADKDAALALWATWPTLLDAFSVMEGWGFKYKTVLFNWIKLNKNNGKPCVGLGNYTRANSEVCLLATRGKGLSRVDKSISQLIFAKRREHSRKPASARTKLVQLFGDVPRIELFAREKIEGWTYHGNEVLK